MRKSPETAVPWLDAGMASLALGSVGLVLFFLPILGLPLSGAGLAFGALGLALWGWGRAASLRWSALGAALGLLALAINFGIAIAPAGNREIRPARRVKEVPDRPYVPPPARPGTPGQAVAPNG